MRTIWPERRNECLFIGPLSIHFTWGINNRPAGGRKLKLLKEYEKEIEPITQIQNFKNKIVEKKYKK
jgi:hypothetical protein